ncbi:MAG: membrane-associated phospholipid phosphatase [Arenicella sp.]|jgi:membrane-associated phospholipid phosphatase
MKYFAKAVSYIFHPIFLPMLTLVIFFQASTIPNSFKKYDALCNFEWQYQRMFYLILGLLLFVAPLLSLGIMVWTRVVKSIELEDKSERNLPFIIVLFYYGFAYFSLRTKFDPSLQHDTIMSFVFGILLVFVLAFIINFYYKISLHAAAIFGTAAAVMAYFQTQIESPIWIAFVLLIIAGIVSSARLYLKAHTLKEVLMGMLIGAVVMYVCVYNGLWL